MQKQNGIKKILIGILSLAFLMGGYSKLAGDPKVLEMFDLLNISGLRIGLGIIEIIIALTLWWKETRTIGALIGTSYLGAAIMAELYLGSKGIAPGILSLLLWTVLKIDLWQPSMCSQCMNPLEQKPSCTCDGTCVCEHGNCDCGKEGCVCKKGTCTC